MDVPHGRAPSPLATLSRLEPRGLGIVVLIRQTLREDDDAVLTALRVSGGGLDLLGVMKATGLSYDQAHAAAVRLDRAQHIDYPGVRVG